MEVTCRRLVRRPGITITWYNYVRCGWWCYVKSSLFYLLFLSFAFLSFSRFEVKKISLSWQLMILRWRNFHRLQNSFQKERKGTGTVATDKETESERRRRAWEKKCAFLKKPFCSLLVSPNNTLHFCNGISFLEIVYS